MLRGEGFNLSQLKDRHFLRSYLCVQQSKDSFEKSDDKYATCTQSSHALSLYRKMGISDFVFYLFIQRYDATKNKQTFL